MDYTDEEHDVWRTVCRELAAKHERLACAEYREAAAAPGPAHRPHPPARRGVATALRPLTGFEYHPAAGVVPFEGFYGSLADGVFHSTQYVRHHDMPLYTPEPDLIHEVIGHGNTLASRRFAELNRLAGQAARRLETEEGRDFFARVFWFTLEFGVIREDGELRAYGAGLLSSFGEIEEFRGADIRDARRGRDGRAALRHHQVPADPVRRRRHGAPGGHARRLLRECDDDTPARLAPRAPAAAR